MKFVLSTLVAINLVACLDAKLFDFLSKEEEVVAKAPLPQNTQPPSDAKVITEKTLSVKEIADKATPATVFIQADVEMEADNQASFYGPFNDDFFQRFFGGAPKQQQMPQSKPLLQRAQGSGFIFTEDGYILTNYHVVKNATKIVVDLNDDNHSVFDAEFIGGDPQTDVAVIKITSSDKKFPFLEFQDSQDIFVGEDVVAIGNPFDLKASVTRGIISAKGRNNLEILDLEDYIQTDAAIYPGNSGGPLIGPNGKVVGMNTAILTQKGNFLGIGFAIPSNIIASIASQIMEKGHVTRGFIGVYLQDVDSKMATVLGLDRPNGAIVTSVSEGSPAAIAGLQQGDVILEVNNVQIRDRDGVRKTIQLMPSGSMASFKINRMNKILALKVQIGEEQKAPSLMGAIAQKLGLSVETLTPELGAKYGYKSDETGSIITDIQKGSIASLGKLKPGMLIKTINHQPITNVEEFNTSLEKTGGRNVFMFVTDANSRGMFVTLSVSQ